MNFSNPPISLSCASQIGKCQLSNGSCQRCRKTDIQESKTLAPFERRRLRNASTSKGRLPPSNLSLFAQQEDCQNWIPRIFSQDRELAIVMDSVQYYNEHVIPSANPAQLPFRRDFVPAEIWPFLPATLKHIWIVIVRAKQANCSLSDPILFPDLCYYRGQSLAGLQKMLSDYENAVNDPYAATLMSMLFVMGADMQLCEEHWTVHLEAARTLISCRGGLQSCFDLPAVNYAPLVNYLHADIMTATACNVWTLNIRAVKSQFEYLEFLPNLDTELLATGHACPRPILVVIVSANILRVSSNRPLTREESILMMSRDITFEKVRAQIEAFDCELWALSVAVAGRALPQRVEDELEDSAITTFSALAQCYKSAALLYFLLSTSNIATHDNTLAQAKSNLSMSLRQVFDMASMDHNDPLHAQLWKFTVWPLFVSAYVKAGWCPGAESVDADVDRFPATATALSSMRLLRIPRFIKQIEEKRAKRGHDKWGWDDGFETRVAFVV